MNVSNRQRQGMTLVELLIVMALLSILGVLLARAFGHTSFFYREVSEQSREVGSATVVLDKLQGLCFGLPRQAITITDTPDGQLMVVQPLDSIGAAGTAIYSSTRVVIESGANGVRWWDINGEDRTLGAPLRAFPPPATDSKVRTLLDRGWTLNSCFPSDRFPLRLELTPPDADRKPFLRTVAGYL